MKNSLMLWVMSVLLLSVMIECKNRTEEEKPKESEPTLVQDNITSCGNSTLNETSHGNLGKAKNLRHIFNFGKKSTSRMERPFRTETEGPKLRAEEQAPSSRTEAPSTRTEAPSTRTEAPSTRTEAPSSRTEAPNSREETEGIKVPNSLKLKRSEAPSSRIETEGPKLRTEQMRPGQKKQRFPSL